MAPIPEIYWNKNDRFAALFYSDEGQDQIHILDAETGKTWQFPDWNKHDSNFMAIDKKSFAWIDSNSFNIDAAICKESKLAPSGCSDNISSALKTKTVFKIQADKLYPSTNDLLETKISADLLIKIDKALSILPKPSEYLYETTSLRGKIVGTWTEMTAGILGTRDLRVAYDNFYQSAVDYIVLDEINLIRARKAALDNDVDAANHLFEAAQRYESQFFLE